MAKALTVNLTTKSIGIQILPEEWNNQFIGGEGIAVRWLCDTANLDPAWAPHDPRQPLLLVTGPCTGTPTPTSGRLVVAFRSPTTRTLGASNVGGQFAFNLKRAGWDLIMVTGRSEKPVYLHVKDDHVSLEDAEFIWGKGVLAAEDALKEKHGRVSIASCGPAGEKLVAYASITVDKERSAGRGGAGALMGGKNLKAFVVQGTKPIPIANPEAMKKAANQARNELLNEEFVRDVLRKHGSPGFFDGISDLGLLPTNNWQKTTFPESSQTLFQDPYHRDLEVKPVACYGCPVACGRHTVIKFGPYTGSAGGGPEFETLGAFGSKCGVTDLNAVARASHLCNDLGLDTISCGQTIATYSVSFRIRYSSRAMEWYADGILPKELCGDTVLKWGDGSVVVEMVQRIGEQKDPLAQLLGLGCAGAAAKLGPQASKAAMHVKGLEMASCGVHASKAEAVVHATSARGADHLRPYASTIDAYGYHSAELGITQKVDPLEDGNKEWIKPFQELSMATNMIGVCLFASITLAVSATAWANCVSAAIGRPISKDELLLAAERVISTNHTSVFGFLIAQDMERMLMFKFGFDRKDDKLPKRFTEEPAVDGKGKGQVVDLNKALDSYYASMGWDLERGLPTLAKLKQLGLDWMVRQ